MDSFIKLVASGEIDVKLLKTSRIGVNAHIVIHPIQQIKYQQWRLLVGNKEA